MFIVDKLYSLVLEGKTFTSCKEIQMKNNITKDGDYYLNIKGRITKVLRKQFLLILTLTIDFETSFSRSLHFPFRSIVLACTCRTLRNIYHWSKVKKTTFLKCMVLGMSYILPSLCIFMDHKEN